MASLLFQEFNFCHVYVIQSPHLPIAGIKQMQYNFKNSSNTDYIYY